MPHRGRFLATVAANTPLCREHNRVTLRFDTFPATAPGQFLQLLCRDQPADAPPSEMFEHEWQPGETMTLRDPDLSSVSTVLRRPFSIAGRRDLEGGAVELDVISRAIGPGTEWLMRVPAGHPVDVIGPLGNTFTLPEPGGIALLVGGGVGIPPMIYLAQALASDFNLPEEASRRKAVAFCGALTRDLMALTITDNAEAPVSADDIQPRYNIAEFDQFGVPAVLTTDDGSYGYRGRVTEALDSYLRHYFANSWEIGSVRPTIYTCGPEPMMKAVADVARRRGLKCQVAVERAMACGMGTCQSCVIRKKADPAVTNDRGWLYQLACTHGPVFEAADLLW